MKLLFAILATLLIAAAAHGQTIKSLGYNTTNGQVSYSGTNVLTFTNSISVSQMLVQIGTNNYVSIADDIAEFRVTIDAASTNGIIFSATNSAAATRTNLGLGLPALTNTNVTNFRAALGLEVTNGYSVNFAGRLWDNSASEQGLLVEDNEIRVGAATANTNAPTNTTNAVRWMNVIAGTNAYKLPLYQ